MRDRTVDRVESWDARPYSGGFATLRDMSDANFSGVVVSGDAWLFMLNGRIVGIVDGDIDDFEDASGTMYEAPDPSLPLLFSMQERGGTTQAKYYTNDTPLDEADRTLSDANFTGYVELSENVLSGDYYLVYYGGRALPVAFVGTSNELKTGDEAYDLATDEVGVYEVVKTPVNVTQVPGPRSDESDSEAAAEGASAGASAGASTVAAESGADTGEAEPDDDVAAPGASNAQADAGEATQPESEPAEAPEPSAEAAAAEEYAADAGDSVVDAAEPGKPDEPTRAGSTERKPAEPKDSNSPEPSESNPSSDDGVTETPATEGSESGGADQPETAEAKADDSSVFSEEEQWRQTKSIPSLSPSEREKRRHQQAGEVASADQQAKRPRSERPEGASESTQGAPSEAGAQARQTPASSQTAQRTQSEQPTAGTADAAETGPAGPSTGGASGSPTETETAGGSGTDAEASAAAKQRITELQSQLEQLDAERDGLKDDLASVRSERDQLQKRVRQLEQALEEAGGDATSGPTLTPDEALAGTNLFVRYGSRGAPTLDDLTGKAPDAEAINKNLRIDHHTQFESTEAAVDGTPFEQFLERSSAYRFVSWLVRELPYEVLDAGHRSDLGDLYDVVPEIDRAELQGVVEVEAEEGAERREFDIVLRDRMGNPLVVAELNDERDPVSGDEMESLIESAQVVGEGAEGLGAAFYVTASFFEPDALENAAEATETGGILSRSDRASYVKLARKRGFHLCLAEDRNDTFHLTVPEL